MVTIRGRLLFICTRARCDYYLRAATIRVNAASQVGREQHFILAPTMCQKLPITTIFICHVAGKFGKEFYFTVWRIVQGITKLKSANNKFTITLRNALQARWLVGVVYHFNVLRRSRIKRCRCRYSC